MAGGEQQVSKAPAGLFAPVFLSRPEIGGKVVTLDPWNAGNALPEDLGGWRPAALPQQLDRQGGGRL